MKPLAELIASVPVHFSGAVFTASELWKEVEEMGLLPASAPGDAMAVGAE